MKHTIPDYFARVASWVNKSTIHQDEVGCFICIEDSQGTHYFYYKRSSKVGKGSFGKVYLGCEYDPLTGELFLDNIKAIKRLRTLNCPHLSLLEAHSKQSSTEDREVALLARFYEVFHKPRELIDGVSQDALIVMPYFRKVNLTMSLSSEDCILINMFYNNDYHLIILIEKHIMNMRDFDYNRSHYGDYTGYSTCIKYVLDLATDLALMHSQRVDPDIRAKQHAVAVKIRKIKSQLQFVTLPIKYLIGLFYILAAQEGLVIEIDEQGLPKVIQPKDGLLPPMRHHDVKCENVIFAESRAYLIDYGVACIVSPENEGLTDPHNTRGTP